MNHSTAASAMQRFLFIAIIIALAFAFQNSRGLWEPDEGRYTDVALEMLRNSSYLTPMLHDERPHFTKPPFTYWAIASSIAVFGNHEWAARLPNSLAYLFTVLLMYQLGRCFMPKRPWVPALVYASLLLPVLGASIVTTDTLLTMWEVLAITAFASAAFGKPGKYQQAWIALMWVAFGMAFLTKGPPGLLPLLSVIAFQITHRPIRWGLLFLPLGVIGFATVAFSWYAAVALKNPALFSYFIRYEFIERVASSAHQRNPQWYGAIAVYLPTLLIGGLPWVGFILAKLHTKHLRHPVDQFRHLSTSTRFLIFWLLLPLVVFFLARSRLPLYVLPLAAPIALLSALAIPENIIASSRFRWLFFTTAILWLGLRGFSGTIGGDSDNRQLAEEIKHVVHWPIHELVFVDEKPRYGLSLYLDAEIERVCFQSECGQQRYAWFQDEPLSSELGKIETDRLFLVKNTSVDAFNEAMRAAGQRLRHLGDVRGLHLMADLPADDGNPP